MNERALELYKQAVEFAYNTIGKEHADTAFFQGTIAGKYGELLIKECMAQCADNGSNDEWDKGVRWAAEQIKQHFGVE